MSENTSGTPSTTPEATPESIDQQNLASDGLIYDSEAAIEADSTLSKAEKNEQKKLLRELELKYNGKTSKEKLPFDIPEEHADWMRRQMQLAKMAQSKAQEQANLEREVVEFFNELRSNPKKALANPNIGVDVKQLVAEILEEELENAQKSPEQLALEEKEKELKELREREKQREEELRRVQEEKVIEQAAQQFDIQMSEILDKYDIPKTPLAIKKMAEYMSLSIQNMEEPDMDLIGQLVEEEMVSDYREHLNSLSPERVVKILGEEIFEKVRKERVSKMKKAQPSAKSLTKDVAQSKPKEEPKSTKKQTFKDFFGV